MVMEGGHIQQPPACLTRGSPRTQGTKGRDAVAEPTPQPPSSTVLTPPSSISVTTRPGCGTEQRESRQQPSPAEPPRPTAAPPGPPPASPPSRCRGGRCPPARSAGCSRG